MLKKTQKQSKNGDKYEKNRNHDKWPVCLKIDFKKKDR